MCTSEYHISLRKFSASLAGKILFFILQYFIDKILYVRWFKAPNLVFEAEHESGGHFAAYEKPLELADDLRKMFGKGSKAFGVVPGKTGY